MNDVVSGPHAPAPALYKQEAFWAEPVFLRDLSKELLELNVSSERFDKEVERAVLLAGALHNVVFKKKTLAFGKLFFVSNEHVVKVRPAELRAYIQYYTLSSTHVDELLQEIENTQSLIAHDSSLSQYVVPYWWAAPNIVCVMEQCSDGAFTDEGNPAVPSADLLEFSALAVPLFHSHGIYPFDWKMANLCRHEGRLQLIDQDMLVSQRQLELSADPAKRDFVPLGAVATYPYKYMCNKRPYNGLFSPRTLQYLETQDVASELYMSVTWSAVITLFLHIIISTMHPQAANDMEQQNAIRESIRMRVFENLNCHMLNKDTFWTTLVQTFLVMPGADNLYEHNAEFHVLLDAAAKMPAVEALAGGKEKEIESFWNSLL